MVESILQACSPAQAFEFCQGALLLRELPQFALVSLATGEADQAELAEPLKARLELSLPPIGHSSKSKSESESESGSGSGSVKDSLRVMGLQHGLWLMLFEHPGHDPVQALHRRLDGRLPATARLTDQSDAWLFLELSGPGCTAVLERLCPIDLHPDTFKVDHLARTVFELMGVILMRTENDCWLMMSARSTASSFVHAVSTAVESAA